MKRLKMAIFPCVLATVTILATLLLLTHGAQAAIKTIPRVSSSCGTWSTVSSPNIAGGDTSFASVAAISANDVWAVGNTDNAVSSIQRTLIEHWDGTKWSVVPSPNASPQNNTLYGVAAASSTDAWAAGYFIGSDLQTHTLIEHWNGTNWSIVSSADPGSSANNLFAITTVKSGDAWTVGFYRSGNGDFQTLIEHWNGSNWSVVSSPNPGSSNNLLYGVTALSANNVWAVGQFLNSEGPSRALIEHWNGSQWSVVPSPTSGPSSDILYAVAAISTDSAWAVGDIEGIHPAQTLIERWNGSNWSVISSPNSGTLDNTLYGVAALSANNAWAVGQSFISNGSTRNLIEHWDGTSWNIVTSANPGTGAGNDILGGIAAISSSSAWTAGTYDTGGNSKSLTEHFC